MLEFLIAVTHKGRRDRSVSVSSFVERKKQEMIKSLHQESKNSDRALSGPLKHFIL
jgi:hypothetical protein